MKGVIVFLLVCVIEAFRELNEQGYELDYAVEKGAVIRNGQSTPTCALISFELYKTESKTINFLNHYLSLQDSWIQMNNTDPNLTIKVNGTNLNPNINYSLYDSFEFSQKEVKEQIVLQDYILSFESNSNPQSINCNISLNKTECLNCDSCQNSDCLKCRTNNFKVEDIKNECWNESKNGYYFDNNQYLKCGANCSTCENKTDCTTCHLHYFPVLNENSCWNEETKKPNYYLNSENVYQPCSENCSTCVDTSENCIMCGPLYYKHENTNSCWTGVNDGFYLDELSSPFQFKKCNVSCETCSDVTNDSNFTKCLSCSTNYYPIKDNDSFCLNEDTKENYYLKDSMYHLCDIRCLYCSKGIDSLTQNPNCDECKDTYYKVLDRLGYCENQSTIEKDDYYFNITENMFVPCNISCVGCNGSEIDDDQHCSKCKEGFLPVENMNTTCYNETNKKSYYFLDPSKKFYARCYNSCLSCERLGNDTEMGCKGCFAGLDGKHFYQYKETENCFSNETKIMNTYFNYSENKFLDCWESCGTCEQWGELRKSNCLTCYETPPEPEPKPEPDPNPEPEPEPKPEPEDPNTKKPNIEEVENSNSRRLTDKETPDSNEPKTPDPNEPETPDPDEPETPKEPSDPKEEEPFPDEEPKEPPIKEKRKYYFIDGLIGQCINETIREVNYSNYYFDEDTTKYYKCYVNCATCSFGGNDTMHNCTKCISSHYNLSNDNSLCYDKTVNRSGYFIDNVKEQFIKCNDRCKECEELGFDTDSRCTECLKDKQYYPRLFNESSCLKKKDLPENYFLNPNELWEICFESCQTCKEKGDKVSTKCLSCNQTALYFPIKDSPAQCFNRTVMMETYPNYFFQKTYKEWHMCYNSCLTCDEGGDDNEHNCTSCLETYAKDFDRHSMCYNEITKPKNYKLNEEGIYQVCTKNVLCEINCQHLSERWYVNQQLLITCIDDLACNDYAPNYYFPTNRCVGKCIKQSIEEPLTRTCVVCVNATNQYLYNNKCYPKCPQGTYPTEEDVSPKPSQTPDEIPQNAIIIKICKHCNPSAPYYDNIKKECVLECSNAINTICNPCLYYFNSTNDCVEQCPNGEDYDKFNSCHPKNKIKDFDLKHNPVDYHPDVMVFYNNQTKNTEYKYIMRRLINTIKSEKEIINQANYIILLCQMITTNIGSATIDEITKILNETVTLFITLLSSPDIEKMDYDKKLTLFLAQYYLLNNPTYLLLEAFEEIKENQYLLLDIVRGLFSIDSNEGGGGSGTNNENYKRVELLSVYSSIMTKINDHQNSTNGIDPNYNPSLSENLYYRIANIFVINDDLLKMKKLFEDYATFSFQLSYPSFTYNKQPHFEIINVPLSYIPVIPDSKLQIILTCVDDSSVIDTMKSKNLTVQVCIPKIELMSQYSDSYFISVIYYNNSYPLYNINVTEVSSNFVTINIYSNKYKRLSIKALSQPFKIYINSFNYDNKYRDCFFYNEEKNTTDANCSVNIFDSYLVCECNHLTDFGLSEVPVAQAMSKDNLLYQTFKVFSSLKSLMFLTWTNAIVLYIAGGFIIFLLITYPMAYSWDKKHYKEFYYNFVMKEYEWRNEDQIIKGINIIKDELQKQTHEPTQEDQADVIIAQNINLFNEMDPPGLELDSSRKKISNITKTPQNKPHESPSNVLSLYWSIFKLFVFYEFRLSGLILPIRNYINKTDLITLTIIRFSLLLTLSGMCTSCQMTTAKIFLLKPIDYFIIFGGVIIVDIVYTIFELALERIPIEKIKINHAKRIKSIGVFRHIVVYLIITALFIIGILNTVWVSIELRKQELFAMLYEDFILSILFDLVVYEFLLVGIKALAYCIIIKSKINNKKQSCIYLFFVGFFAAFPSLFAVRWNEQEIVIFSQKKTNKKSKAKQK